MQPQFRNPKTVNFPDITIGPIVAVFDDSTFKMRVERIGSRNRFTYNDFETVCLPKSAFRLTSQLIGKKVQCRIHFRNEYNVLQGEMETL